MLPTGIHPFIGAWLANDEYSAPKGERTISATTLLKSVKQIVLTRRVEEPAADLNSLIASRIGTAAHGAIEATWRSDKLPELLIKLKQPAHKYVINPVEVLPGQIPVWLEQRREKEFQGWTITGQFDTVFNYQLRDIKLTRAWAIQNHVNDDKWAKQGAIYKWLFPEIIKDADMVIEAIAVDWSRSSALSDPSYPAMAWTEVRLRLDEPGSTELWLTEKLSLLEKYLHSPQDEIPECTDEELWRDPPTWAYYASGVVQGRCTKKFATKQEAEGHLLVKGKGIIEERKGQPKACGYCPAQSICNQYMRMTTND